MNTIEKNFDKIYKKNHNRILKYVNFKVHNMTIAEELTNDIFIKFNNYFQKFVESGLDEKTYLFNITKSKIIDWSRNKEYTRRHELVSIDSTFDVDSEGQSYEDVLEDTNKTPDELLKDAETLQSIRKILNNIKNKNIRQCIEHRYFDGMNYDEICKETGFTLEMVKINLHRGLHEIKHVITKNNMLE